MGKLNERLRDRLMEKETHWIRNLSIWACCYLSTFLLFLMGAYFDMISHPYIKEITWRWWLFFTSQHAPAVALMNGIYWPFAVFSFLLGSFIFFIIWLNFLR